MPRIITQQEYFDRAEFGLTQDEMQYAVGLENPLNQNPLLQEKFPGLQELQLMLNPEYLFWTCKVILNVNLLPIQAMVIAELWNRPFPMFLASRGYGKSFTLAVYAMLKCILIPNSKIVIVGAAFRQSKIIFDYMEGIWKNAPILRDLCGNSGKDVGPKRDIDRCTMHINGGWAIAVPLGNGEKIRGLRAHTIISDEFGCLDKDSIIETDNGFIRIADFDSANDKYLLTGNDQFEYEKPTRFIKTPKIDVYEIKLKNGYVIKCSEIHRVMTKNGWKKPLELTDDDYVEQSNDFCENFGKDYVSGLDEKMAWLLGMLVSEGSVTNKNGTISITTTDENTKNKLINDYGFNLYTRDAYIDNRGWDCKESYMLYKCDVKLRKQMLGWGLKYVTAHKKVIPSAILASPKSVIQSFLSGLFNGDGSCFLWDDRKLKNRIGLAYYSVSERLCRDVQFLMYKFGFDGSINNRNSNLSDNKQWFVRWNGPVAKSAAEFLNVDRFKYAIDNCYIRPKRKYYCWDKSRNKWKVSININGQTIQKRFQTEQEAISFIRKIKSKNKYRKVVSVKKLKEKQHLYDYYLPKTHSFYAEGHRQHNSIPPDIYETVVAGFAAVSADPIANVRAAAKRKAMKDAGKWSQANEFNYKAGTGNQSIISGTATYSFTHFAEYWRRYKTFVDSKGDPDKLREYFPDGPPDDFNWRDYSVIRIPYELIPEGFMEAKVVSRAKATVHSGIFNMEYGCVFSEDSNGFFKRSLIESCVASDKNINSGNWPKYCQHPFTATVRGNPRLKYVFGVDPASEIDNFSIVVLELHPEHTRVVYGWTIDRERFKERVKYGLAKEYDFYAYCARKIRDLMKIFPCAEIAIDGQGGGIAVSEALQDPDKLSLGESPILPVIDPDKKQETDNMPGMHILKICQFAKADWTAEANHGLKKDMEDKALLFPYFDALSLGEAFQIDKIKTDALPKNEENKRYSLYDSLEDSVMEIEELKDELSTIVHTRTGNGVNSRDRWDTPETKLEGGKKGRLRKDRYSALVMANMSARSIQRAIAPPAYEVIGDFTSNIMTGTNRKIKGKMYNGGHEWLSNPDSFYS